MGLPAWPRPRSLPTAASYWLGAPGGQPLPCLRKQVDRGEVRAIREGVVPRLESRGLLGPWEEGDPPRLTAAFDREGWSPALFAGLRAQGIAVPSRVKGAQEERRPEAEFAPARFVVSAPCSESVRIGRVADRPLDPGAKGPPAREIRFRSDFRLREPGRTGRPRRPQRLAGHPRKGQRQASIVTTQPTPYAARAAGLLRSRRAQENLFQYMRGDFGLATLRILAYRAETRMTGQPGPGLGSPQTARSLLRALFERPASLRHDPAAGTLTVRPMPMATQAQDEALARLVAELNRSETIYPGTDPRLVCELPIEPEPPAPLLPPAGGPPSAPGTGSRAGHLPRNPRHPRSVYVQKSGARSNSEQAGAAPGAGVSPAAPGRKGKTG